MEQHDEEWEQCNGFPCYWVSNFGEVKRLYKNGDEKFLKPWVKQDGYLCIDLVRRPKRISKLIHVMVAECFIPNPKNKPYVDHINNNKEDNRVENLRWVTNSENQMNMINPRKSNTSGCIGIHSRKYNGKHVSWRVRLGLNNKRINIGDFKDYEDAVKARHEAEKKYFGEFAPSRE